MWILELLGESAIHLLSLVGIVGIVAGFVLGFIPIINKYKLPIQIISTIVAVIAVYLEGGLAEQYKHKVEVAELKQKLAEAEAKSAKVNTQIITKILTKKQIVKEKGDEVIRYIDREVTKYDETCPIPKPVINALNAAAKNKTVEELIGTEQINQAAKPPMKLPKK